MCSDGSPSQSLQVSRAEESATNTPTMGKIHPSTQQLTDRNAKTDTPTCSSTGFMFWVTSLYRDAPNHTCWSECSDQFITLCLPLQLCVSVSGWHRSCLCPAGASPPSAVQVSGSLREWWRRPAVCFPRMPRRLALEDGLTSGSGPHAVSHHTPATGVRKQK